LQPPARAKTAERFAARGLAVSAKPGGKRIICSSDDAFTELCAAEQ
jgi:hypothetical protein